MKIILAPDKFKGSLTGLQFCNAVEAGLKQSNLNAQIIKLPLADGGDGTIEVANYYLQGELVNVTVNNPFFKQIQASYLYAEQTNTAFIEMAEAAGLKLLKPSEYKTIKATSFGVGELILHAINKGAKTIILGIGGSATTDCGIGMATALGYEFLDAKNEPVKPIAENLAKIKTINTQTVHPKLKEVTFKVACDVENTLYGKNGAAYVYAKQKGATASEIAFLDSSLQDFSKIINKTFGVASETIVGGGASGGLGVGSVVFLNGTLQSGINLIKELAQFDAKVSNADWIITGEGKLDAQTLYGKTIQGIVSAVNQNKTKLAAFCGAIELTAIEIKKLNFTYTDAVINWAKNTQDAMANSATYLQQMAKKFANQQN